MALSMLFSDMLAAVRNKGRYGARDLLRKVGGSDAEVGKLAREALTCEGVKVDCECRCDGGLALSLRYKSGKDTCKNVSAACLGEGGGAGDVDVNVLGIGYDRACALEDENDAVLDCEALGNLESVELDRRDVGH